MGRRKIEIERILDKHNRFICFSKRRKGLFKKANALARQGFHIIILVFSKSGNAFVYGSQNEIIKRFLNNSDATNGAGSSNVAENLINETSETAEQTEENNTASEHSVDSAGEISKESDITSTVASEDSWNSLNSILTESEHFWWNSSVENLSWKNLLQFKSAMEDLLSRVRTKANSLLVEQNFLSGFT